jgi:hypothetical protein
MLVTSDGIVFDRESTGLQSSSALRRHVTGSVVPAVMLSPNATNRVNLIVGTIVTTNEHDAVRVLGGRSEAMHATSVVPTGKLDPWAREHVVGAVGLPLTWGAGYVTGTGRPSIDCAFGPTGQLIVSGACDGDDEGVVVERPQFWAASPKKTTAPARTARLANGSIAIEKLNESPGSSVEMSCGLLPLALELSADGIGSGGVCLCAWVSIKPTHPHRRRIVKPERKGVAQINAANVLFGARAGDALMQIRERVVMIEALWAWEEDDASWDAGRARAMDEIP